VLCVLQSESVGRRVFVVCSAERECRAACVLCAVQSETVERRVCCVLCRVGV